MWLSWQNNREKHQIPVLPPSFEVETSNLNTVVNINELGNILLIGNSDLRKISIESFFPNQDYSFVTTKNRWDPYTYIESIERWRKSKKPIRLIITDTPINLALGIENFKYGERDGSGDVYYSLEMSEYIFTNLKEQSKKEYSPPSTSATNSRQLSDFELQQSKEVMEMLVGRGDTRDIPDSYTVKPGDTLTTIAKMKTGNASNYSVIAEKNGIKNPNLITPGMVLKL